jgi:hypothetical protein
MSNTQPTLIAFSVKERGEGKQAIWTNRRRISAWHR